MSLSGVTSSTRSAENGMTENTNPWPLNKLLRVDATKTAVILTTGGMNPVHRGHVQLLHQARARLEEQGFTVIGIWLSPSHDGYVQPKAKNLRTVGLTSAFRLEVARCAVSEDQLVSIGAWEAQQPGNWPDFPEVTSVLDDEMGKLHQQGLLKARPAVFYACGTDHANKCNLYRWKNVVVVPRLGDNPQQENPASQVFVAKPCEGEVASFSSTDVRAAIARNDFDYVAQSMSRKSADFLLQPSPEAYNQFASDFAKLGVQAPSEQVGATEDSSEQVLTPVFLSNSVLARFFQHVPQNVRDSCILFFGSKENEIFGKARPDYDEFIRQKQKDGKFHSLKPPGWREGKPCDMKVASGFFQENGFNPLQLDMEFYEGHLDLNSLIPEAKGQLRSNRSHALSQIKENFEEAESGTGCFGHDYGPVLAMVHLADRRLFPILGKEGLAEFLKRTRRSSGPI